jgi:hypothetical protein
MSGNWLSTIAGHCSYFSFGKWLDVEITGLFLEEKGWILGVYWKFSTRCEKILICGGFSINCRLGFRIVAQILMKKPQIESFLSKKFSLNT